MDYILYIVCVLLCATLCSVAVIIYWFLWWDWVCDVWDRIWDWLCGMENRAVLWVVDLVLGKHEIINKEEYNEANHNQVTDIGSYRKMEETLPGD